jgi:outer membrane protein OmpA-like peptidoglycan-associated protein
MDLLSPSRAVLQAVPGPAARWRAGALAVLAAGWLGACSSLPDELNPVEWVSSVDRYLSSDDEEVDAELAARIEAERAQPVPGAEEDFPSLGTVPGEAPRMTTYEEREEIAEGLVADRAAARYTENPAAEALGEELPWNAGEAAAERRDIATLVAPPPPVGAQVPATVVPAAGAPEPMSDGPGPATAELGTVEGSAHVGVIYYAYGSASLSENDKEVLTRIAEAWRAYGGTVRVVGHASGRGDSGEPVDAKIANFAIAYDRARFVAEELIRLGVPFDRIYVSSMADSDPAYSEATELGEAANRRTDIYLDFARPPG